MIEISQFRLQPARSRVALAMGVLSLAGCTSDCQTVALPGGPVAQVVFSSWHGKAQQCRVGDFVVMSPTTPGSGQLVITKNGHTEVIITGPKKEVDVLDGDRPVLTVQNRSGKDGYDFISYKIRNTEGKVIGDVTDGDMDGQPDFKLLDDGIKYAYVDSTWLVLERHGNQTGVIGPNGWQAVQSAEAPFKYVTK
jgi:hypothetical protein